MKLIRFGEPGRERPGLLLPDGTRIDATGFGSDYDEAFFGGDGLRRLRAWLEDNQGSAPRVSRDLRLGPPHAISITATNNFGSNVQNFTVTVHERRN